MSEIRRPYLENLQPLPKDVGSGREKPGDDLVEERYDMLQDEWDRWKEASKAEEFDVINILDHMGFFNVNEKGKRIYTDDELQACINNDETANEEALFDLFMREAERRSLLNDEGYSPTTDLFEKPNERKREFSVPKPVQLDFVVFPPSDRPSIQTGSGAGVERCENMDLKNTFRKWLRDTGVLYEEKGSAPIQNRDTETMRTDDYSVFLIYTDSSKRHLTKSVYVSDQYGVATVVAHDLELFEEDAWQKVGGMNETVRKETNHGYHLETVQWQGKEKDWLEAVKGVLEEGYEEKEIYTKNRQNTKTKIDYTEQRMWAPVGWEVVGNLGDKLGICNILNRSNVWVNFRIKKLLIKHPEWGTRPYLNKTNQLFQHYPPEMVEALTLEASQEQPAPLGWEVAGSLEDNSGICGIVNRGDRWVKSRIKKILKDHPEWDSKRYYQKSRRLYSHYPPEMVDALKLKASQEISAPVGWEVISGICGIVNRGVLWVKPRIKKILKDHPEWAGKPYLDKSKKISQHYPPEIVEVLKSEASQEQPAPLGWEVVGTLINNSGICGIVGLNRSIVESHIKKILKDHPEWDSKPYLDKSSQLNLHYPPEMITELNRLKDLE